jgi:hypothetical protein
MTKRQDTPLETPITVWRKSTRSASGADQNCIEIAVWRKSTRSDNSTGQCVEVTLRRKSTKGPDI